MDIFQERLREEGIFETRPDVQAAVTVIGRRDSTHDGRLVDLNTAELAFANLTRANFTHAILTNADPEGGYEMPTRVA